MQKLDALIEKYTRPPFNNTPEAVEDWWKSHRSLGGKASQHEQKTKRILKPKPVLIRSPDRRESDPPVILAE